MKIIYPLTWPDVQNDNYFADLSKGELDVLSRAARLYDDALDLLIPPMNTPVAIEKARKVIGTNINKGWHQGIAIEFLCWRTGLSKQICDAFLNREFEQLEDAGLIGTRVPMP